VSSVTNVDIENCNPNAESLLYRNIYMFLYSYCYVCSVPYILFHCFVLFIVCV